jgi:hypothetical protein
MRISGLAACAAYGQNEFAQRKDGSTPTPEIECPMLMTPTRRCEIPATAGY